MKNLMKVAVIAVMVLLIGGLAYAEKECKKEAATDVNSCKAKGAGAAGEKKECFLSKLFGKKDPQQQLNELDEKAAKKKAKSDEKIAKLESELADAQAASDTKKAEKIEKKITREKEKLEKEMKKIEDKRAKIEAKMAKKE